MNQIIRTSFIIMCATTPVILTHAQTHSQKKPTTTVKKTNTQKPGSQDTVANVPKTKIEKTVDMSNDYVKLADDEKNMFRKIFPAKGDTVYAIIAGISYADSNLKLLKQEMDNVKNTKGLTASYHKGSAIIRVVYKNGDASNLYDNLSEDIKQLFPVEDIDGCRMILDYKLAKQSVSAQ